LHAGRRRWGCWGASLTSQTGYTQQLLGGEFEATAVTRQGVRSGRWYSGTPRGRGKSRVNGRQVVPSADCDRHGGNGTALRYAEAKENYAAAREELSVVTKPSSRNPRARRVQTARAHARGASARVEVSARWAQNTRSARG
jgi:hypothetical protein